LKRLPGSQSPPHRGMFSLAVMVEDPTQIDQRLNPLLIGACSRSWPRKRPQCCWRRSQSPPHRGMFSLFRALLNSGDAKALSLNPLLIGACSRSQSESMPYPYGRPPKSQSPPHRGMFSLKNGDPMKNADGEMSQSPPHRGMFSLHQANRYGRSRGDHGLNPLLIGACSRSGLCGAGESKTC